MNERNVATVRLVLFLTSTVVSFVCIGFALLQLWHAAMRLVVAAAVLLDGLL